MNVKVHVEGIRGSGRIKEGEEPSVLFNGILEVDGHVVIEVSQIEVVFRGGEFTSIKAHLVPGSFEVVTHTDESWPELLQRINKQAEARAGDDSIIARQD